MDIRRTAEQRLHNWKDDPNRKPLLIRGARQVGKTTLIRGFSKNFERFIELNLERENDRRLFEEIDDINKLFNAILLRKQVSTDGESTLLFIDEIQESPKAIQQLRYFYEDKPEIFIVAAGSLLEFSLEKVPSFPVGRIQYLYLYPLNFQEYLHAVGHMGSVEIMDQVPVADYAHDSLLNSFHDFITLGGMPEIINAYRNHKDFSKLGIMYDQLWQTYKDDVEKYGRGDVKSKVIRHVIATAPFEKDRIKMEGFGSSSYKSREIGEALRALDLAKIIRLIYPTTSLVPPAQTDFKKSPRLQFLDTGLLNSILGLQGQMLSLNDMSDLHRGRIIQHIVGQELISIHSEVDFRLHFWVREKPDRSSEVDLVYSVGDKIIPIEIKSGKQGKLRSLHQFIERTNHVYAVRMYAGKFSVEQHNTPAGKPYLLMNLPYYLGTKIPEYLEYFISNFKLE